MRLNNIIDEECSSPLVVPGVNPSSTESGKGSNEPLVSPRKRRSLAEHGYIFMTVTQVVRLCLLAFVVGACIPIAMKLNRMRTHTTTGSAATSGSTSPTITIQTPTDQLFNNLRQPPSLLKTDKSRIKANTNLKIAWRKYYSTCFINYSSTATPSGVLRGDTCTSMVLSLSHSTCARSPSTLFQPMCDIIISGPTSSLSRHIYMHTHTHIQHSHVLSEFRCILYVILSLFCQ